MPDPLESSLDSGSVAEWFKAAVLKTVEPKGSVSSNLTTSANQSSTLIVMEDPL